jgi:nitrogen-specific signal transduction histidine kinase
MRIEFERTGGVAGMRLAASLASDTLPEPDARELTRLIEASRFFDLPDRIEEANSSGDRFGYAITIDEGSRSHTVQISEAAVPAALRPLIGWLTAAARRRDAT